MALAEPFLTAWDPMDLSMSSIDPLGFARGYQFLADAFLPGLTNAASLPRYLSVLCAGSRIACDDSPATRLSKAEREERLGILLRFERFWALACVLAGRTDELDTRGLRGVTFASKAADELTEQRLKATAAGFRMFQRQATFGVLGGYGNVASGMNLFENDALSLPSELSESLAEAFIKESGLDNATISKIKNGDQVSLKNLEEWGTRAHFTVSPGKDEASALWDAFAQHPTRARATALLRSVSSDATDELERLQLIASSSRANEEVLDLVRVLDAIIAYEACYRAVLVPFERLLWGFQTNQPVRLSDSTSNHLEVIEGALGHARAAQHALEAALAMLPATPAALASKLGDVRAFMERAAAGASASELIDCVLGRHRDVQHGKFHQGARKAPWMQLQQGEVQLLTPGPRIGAEPLGPDDRQPHFYRTQVADRFAMIAAQWSLAA